MYGASRFLRNTNTIVLPMFPSPEHSTANLSMMTASEIFSPKPTPRRSAPPSVNTLKPSRKKNPGIQNMVDEAIFEKCPYRKGLSLIAIKKFLHEKYNLNIKRSAKKIRAYIRESLGSGRFIQKTGRGARGSFRLATNVRASLRRRQSRSLSENNKGVQSKTDTSRQTSLKRKSEMSDSPTTPKKQKLEVGISKQKRKMRTSESSPTLQRSESRMRHL